MQQIKKHIDGYWWTTEYAYLGHALELKMRKDHGSKIHIWNLERTKVIKTFRWTAILPEKALRKATTWIDQQKLLITSHD